MPALACQVIEPAGNVVRLGPEGASQLQRKATASVLYILSGGQTATIAANTPAIPWTASTGFGSAQNAPTAAATIDVTTYAGRWVTFLVAVSGGTFAAGQMYVCQVTDWTAVAGPAGGRTVIPLDLWELHSWRYCGIEFTGDQTLRQSGTYPFTTTDIPANADYSAVKTIVYPIAYGAGLTPAVVATSQDKDWFATAAPTPGAVTTHIDVQLTRYWRLHDRRQTGYQSAAFLSGENVSGNPAGTVETVTYPTAYQSGALPSLALRVETIDPGTALPTGISAADYIAVLQSQSVTGFTFLLYYRPAQGTPAQTSDAPSGVLADTMLGILGAPVKATATADTGATGSTDTNSDGTVTGGVQGTPSTGAQDTNHHHTTNIPNADYSTGTHNLDSGNQSASHSHGLAPPGSDHTHLHNASSGNHTHPVGIHTHPVDNHHHDVIEPASGAGHHHSLTQPGVSGSQTRVLIWTAIGPLTAPAAAVTASWMAAG